MKYAVAVVDAEGVSPRFLINNSAMGHQVSRDDEDFLSVATFDSPGTAATQIARFGALWPILAKMWTFRIVRVESEGFTLRVIE